MARYVDDYGGITGHDMPPQGMDPNYRAGYRGMRYNAGPWQAEYGRYRAMHPGEFSGRDSFMRSSGRPAIPPMMEPRFGGRSDGGVRDIRYDRELLREFNANSPALSRRRSGYDDEQRTPLPRRLRGSPPRFDPDYADRGMADGGYSEGWAWGPMRGAR